MTQETEDERKRSRIPPPAAHPVRTTDMSWLLVLPVLVWTIATGVDGQWTQRKTAILDGDITIGYLFAMHEEPVQKSLHMRTCGRIREEYGIQRAEATFQTIESINANPAILPGIRLGVEIRDDCWNTPVALEQTLEFIRDAISAPATNSTAAVAAAAAAAAEYNKSLSSNFYYSRSNNNCNNSTNGDGLCPKRRKVLVGVIGPGSSTVSIQVQNLLQLFHIPQIGYSATSSDLSDKERFHYFLRVVPPDELQARAMLQIVQKYNWTYVLAVSTGGNYGQGGMQEFRKYADREGICIAKESSILNNDGDSKYDQLMIRFMEEPKARVIVCFCEGETVNAILRAIRRFNKTGHFLIVGSDGWADRLDTVKGYEAEAEGGISIRIHSPPVASFDRDYVGLKPDKATRTRNPWFQEFWETRFNCTFPDSLFKFPAPISMMTQGNSTENPRFNPNKSKICTGNESLQEGYKQDTKLGFVIKATMTMALALHHLQQQVCGVGSRGLCPAMLPINGSLLMDYLRNVSFNYGNETVQFDANGNPPGWYDIMNYQHKSGDRYGYVKIGSWKNGTLDIPDRPAKMVTSVCSEPCPNGHIKIIQKELSCCWQCVPCDAHQRVLNETACQDCPEGYLPDRNTNECQEIELEFGKWSDSQSIVAVTLSIIGLLTTTFTAFVFGCHNDTPVVKASTRELTYMILVGMALCYLTTFPLLAPPTKASCTLSRILPGFSFSLIFAALLTKTNRIARILAGSKKRICTRRSRWLSLTAQILITLTMICIEVVLIVAMLIIEPADAFKFYPTRTRVLVLCNTTTYGLITPLGFDFFLIGMCTVYAIKTRNLPENFNEAKFIGFAMYTTCVIWVAFVPIYFSSMETRNITLCMCVSLSAVVTLILLFGPKLYIIIFKPEKNNRSSFTTTNDLRVFVGGTVKYNPQRSSAFSSSSNHATNSKNRDNNSSIKQEKSVVDGNNKMVTLSAAQLNNGDKIRTNMTCLRRAFGSQLDLGTDVNSSLKKYKFYGSQERLTKRSIEVQTDIHLISGSGRPSCGRKQRQRSKSSDSRSYSSPDGGQSCGSLCEGSPCRRRFWTSITERRVADEEDAADIIISLGDSLPRLAADTSGVVVDNSAVGFRLSQSATSSVVRLDLDDALDNEAYCRLQSLGITVTKASSANIL